MIGIKHHPSAFSANLAENMGPLDLRVSRAANFNTSHRASGGGFTCLFPSARDPVAGGTRVHEPPDFSIFERSVYDWEGDVDFFCLGAGITPSCRFTATRASPFRLFASACG